MTHAPPEAPARIDQAVTLSTVHFPDGLFGFPSANDYDLEIGPGEGLYWLRPHRPDAPRFVVADPFQYFDDYSLDLTDGQVELLDAAEPSDVAVLVVTVPDRGGVWTANLQGPLVLNVGTGSGHQLVLPDQALGVRREFAPRLARPPQTGDEDVSSPTTESENPQLAAL